MVRRWLGSLALVVIFVAVASSQPAPRTKTEPVAETRLLMEGLAHSNFRGLNRLLKTEPENLQTWTFIRGQALLLSETGNLLLLRPPSNRGEPVWKARAVELRQAAKDLACFAADQDYRQSRRMLEKVSIVCNRCHQTFRVPQRLKVSEESK